MINPSIGFSLASQNKMKITERNPKELKHYKLNAKKHPDSQIAGLAESIKKFGFIQPVVLDKNDEIIIGHGRTMAAIRAGLEKIPTVKLETLTEQEAKALRLIDNRIAESGYDIDLLKMDIETLEVDLKPFNVSFDDLIPQEEKEVIEDEGGAEPSDELTEKWGVKIGQIWQLGNHRVMCGDSTNAEQVAKLMNGQKAEMMFTDPPYGVNYEGGHFHSGDVNIKRKREKLAADDNADIYDQFLKTALNFIDGPCYVWFADSKSFEVYRALSNHNTEIHALIIWHKTNATYAALNSQYKQRHEPCIYFKPKGSTLRWNGPTDECTVWEIKRDSQNKFHPTQKPIELSARAMKNHKATIICDLFLGSGSTLIAAEQLDRRCFGMEISPQYVAVIIDRWATFTGKTPELIDNGEA